MKLARFTINSQTAIGIVVGDSVVEISSILPEAPLTIKGILAEGPALLHKIQEALKTGGRRYDLNSVRLEAPIPDPQKYLAIGLNYKDHLEEAIKAGREVPKSQIWFNKQVSCIVGPYDDTYKPRNSEKMDYEIELGVVIGKRCRHVLKENAKDVIGGYFVANDISARDWQYKSATWTLGKSFDTHGPTGPWIVTADELPDPHNLDMKLYVNGELRQSTNTSLMIYNIFDQIAYLTEVMTLEPGDLIATGTCKGVGQATNNFLVPGDVVRAKIESIGFIENKVITEPD